MPIPDRVPMICVPMVTPFDDKDRVDHDAIAFNLDRWKNTPLTAFLVGSQSGEEWSLCDSEKLDVARSVAAHLEGDRFLLGGIDTPSITETLRQIDQFAEVGAEAVRIRFPRTPDTVVRYFEEVLIRSSLPVLLMHQGAPSSFGIAGPPAASAETIARITTIEGVFGYVTDHDLRFESRVRHLVPDHIHFWICNGSLAMHGALMRCTGTTTAFSNIWPEALYKILELGRAGRFEEVRNLQKQVQEIDAIMLPYLAAGVKAAMNIRGLKGTHPRSPVSEVPPAVQKKLEAAMTRASIAGLN